MAGEGADGGGGRREGDAQERDPNLLTKAEVLALLGISRSTLRNWQISGKLVPVPKPATVRAWEPNYYRREDVERLLNEGR